MLRPLSIRNTLAGGLIVVAVVIANLGSLSTPFLFDDERAIVDNPTIRHLSDVGAVLSPPRDGSGVTGRPLVNFTLAVNYALSGTAVRGYHVFNLLLHALSALLVFGLVRRTLLTPFSAARFRVGPVRSAWFIALLWALHPLQTESVTCMVQRTELLVGLFYLLTLYCFVRSSEATAARFWPWLSVGACLAGMACKEVMVTAPLIVWFYDRTFVAGSFRVAWNGRWRFYAGLAATWLLLLALVAGNGGTRGTSAGFGLGVPWWSYALTQCAAIVHYLRLAVWPTPLVLDYGTAVVTDFSAVAPQALILMMLVAGTLLALRRAPAIGFLGAWFFVILAPSSSIVPLVTQTMAEHRMYLPLAAIVTLAGAGLVSLGFQRGSVVGAAIAIAFMVLTARRNRDYRSELSIWSVTLAQCPGNARAEMGAGLAQFHLGKTEAALEHLWAAARLKPADPVARYNLGLALFKTGRIADAIASYEAALHVYPDYANAHYNLGVALFQSGRIAEAIAHFQLTLRLRPEFAAAHNNLGTALSRSGRLPEALAQFRAAATLDPTNAEAFNNLGMASVLLGRNAEARQYFLEALRLRPEFSLARENLVRLPPPSPAK